MMTEEELPKPMQDSEEKLDIRCSPCSEKGTVKEAEKFCMECKSYLCDMCLQYHEQFPALRLHQVVDKSQSGSDSGVTGAPKERCSIHPGHRVDRYCKDHEEICCEACITIKHRSCVKVDNLTDVAKGITDSKEHKDIIKGLDSIIKRIKTKKENGTITLSCLDKKKDSVLKDIDEFEDKLVKKIKEAAEVSRKKVVSKHAEHVKAVHSDIKKLETVLSLAEDSRNNVCASGHEDAQVFVNIKNGKKVETDVQAIVKELSNNKDSSDFYYSFDKTLSDTVMTVTTLGNFDNARYSLSATKSRLFNVTSKEVNAICVFENGSLAFIECANETLTRLTSNYALIGTWKLNMHPVSLCASGQQEVALALRDENRVQFIAWEDGTFSIGNSFKIPQICAGIGYDFECDQLYICFAAQWGWNKSGKVDVCTRNGTLLKTYVRDEAGTQMFSSPNHIAISSSAVYVADSRKGLVAFNKDGKKLWTFTDAKLKDASGVCLLSDTELLVTGLNSNNILHITNDRKEILACEFLGAEELLNKPFALAFDKLNSRIIVGCKSDVTVITEYTLSKLPRQGHSNYSLLNMKV
ncbi:uncharacterized protein LOC123526176 [Mercenaria mercenaria]|uniref:uncharacterized protein LOC123526176 n=1 Tax=Mercenaria mercenaria TaxID=6596 RepID=UPI00234E7861|nr:uncharacterized protein LOC123526176 [Mercenaria mercenaria]